MGSLLSWFKVEEEVFYDAECDLPMESTEGNHPLELLTQDDWIHVLTCVHMPMDGWNVAHAHPLFWTIFHSDLKELWISGMFLSSVPFLLNYLPFKDVLGLRLVNRFSRLTVDHCLGQGQVISLKKYETRVFLDPQNMIFGWGVHRNTRMPEIAPWMKLHLVCSGIQYRLVDFLSFSRHHGAQVENLSVFPLHNQRSHPVQLMTSLSNMLRYLPNVNNVLLDVNRSLEGIWESDHQRLADLVSQFLEQNPFPVLPSLETLTLLERNWPRRNATRALVPQAILQAYGCQLQELELRIPVNLPKGMVCLHTLTLELKSPEDLPSIRASGAPLRSLTLEIQRNSGIKPIQLFWALQPFKNTLTHLHLDTWDWVVSRIGELAVKWPLVKSLALSDNFRLCTPNNLWFCLSFPNLEELELWISLPDPEDDRVRPEERREMLREYTVQFEVEQLQKSKGHIQVLTKLGPSRNFKIYFSYRAHLYLNKTG